MTSDALVSIVIPTYYRNDWLRTAIDSARAQTYEQIEIIVVDDSGERFAEPVAQEYDVTYIAHDENRGGNPARNTGIAIANGEYIQLLDDDDRLLPTKIEKSVAVLESSPSIGVVYTGIRQPNGTVVLPSEDNRGDVLKQALQITELHPCQTTTMLFDGNLLRELSPLANRAAGDDLGLKIRAATRTQFEFINEVLVLQGDPDTHRVAKLEYADEIRSIVNEFDYLYDQFDDQVRRNAIATAYQGRGFRLMKRSWWSPEAINCFTRAIYYRRSLDPHLIGALISAIFGRPMYSLASRLFHLLSRNRTRTD